MKFFLRTQLIVLCTLSLAQQSFSATREITEKKAVREYLAYYPCRNEIFGNPFFQTDVSMGMSIYSLEIDEFNESGSYRTKLTVVLRDSNGRQANHSSQTVCNHNSSEPPFIIYRRGGKE